MDSASGDPLAARVTLRNTRGRPALPRGVGVAPLGDHAYLEGGATLELRRGNYTFELDAGPERRTRSGHFEMLRRSDDEKRVDFSRVADLAAEGWWAGDLDAQRPRAGLDVALRAEQLAYSPQTAWLIDRAGTITPSPAGGGAAVRVESAGGPLLLIREQGEATLQDAQGARPRGCADLARLRAEGWRVVAADLAAVDLPVWLAHGVLDAVVVTGPPPPRKGEGGLRPPDEGRFRGEHGAAKWREHIYFQLLNSGFRTPPVAGSGSGANESPLGSARVYAALDGRWSVGGWWDAVRAGRVVVTNGPLLRPTMPPGSPTLPHGAERDASPIGLSLTTRRPVEYIDVVENGQVTQTLRVRELAAAGGKLPKLGLGESGWWLLRAAAEGGAGYERAMTAPYGLGDPTLPAVSVASCDFFLAGLREPLPGRDPAVGATAEDVRRARAFWAERRAQASGGAGSPAGSADTRLEPSAGRP